MCIRCHTGNPDEWCGTRKGRGDPSTELNVCETKQAYCSIGRQRITSHGDINPHPAIACVAKDQEIRKNWTAAYWNALIDELGTAEKLGH